MRVGDDDRLSDGGAPPSVKPAGPTAASRSSVRSLSSIVLDCGRASGSARAQRRQPQPRSSAPSSARPAGGPLSLSNLASELGVRRHDGWAACGAHASSGVEQRRAHAVVRLGLGGGRQLRDDVRSRASAAVGALELAGAAAPARAQRR
jgi:hypothetical protein